MDSRKILSVFLLLISTNVFAQSKLKPDAPLEVRQGIKGVTDIVRLDFAPDKTFKISIGDPTILKVVGKQDLRQLRVTPLKKGTTSVNVEDRFGRIRKRLQYNVITSNLSQKVQQISGLLQDIEGITITVVGDKVVIDGELIVPTDLDRILQVREAFQKDTKILILTRLSKVSQQAIAQRIQKEIQRNPGGANVTVRLSNNTYFLEGTVDSAVDKQRAESIARTYVPEILKSKAVKDKVLQELTGRQPIANLIVIQDPPPPPRDKLVRVTFHFVEMGKEYAKVNFFKWNPTLTDGGSINLGESSEGGLGSSGSFVGSISNLLPRLQAGSNAGFARVLFSSVAIGKNKTPIEIRRNLSIPFVGSVVDGVPVNASDTVGVNIKVEPEIKDDFVDLASDFSFDSIAGVGAGGQPRKNTTRVSNVVTVRSGDSAVLGGLVSNDVALDVDKDPEQGGEGNPLFTLLRSKAFRNNKTQFLVFITPLVIGDAAKGTADIKKRIVGFRKRRQRQYQ